MKSVDWPNYAAQTDQTDWLKAHRDWVEEHHWGFGDRSLHYMWFELCQELPKDARLMEIGVYRGQILSLWRLLSDQFGKAFKIWGLTPLEATTDKYHTHENHEYYTSILQIHEQFQLKPAIIIKGYSTDPAVIAKAPKDLDVLYIDGGHDEATVRSDIEHYVPLVKPGGFVVFDDASCYLEDYGHWYKGLEDVSRVVDEFLVASYPNFKEYRVVGHNRIFRREA